MLAARKRARTIKSPDGPPSYPRDVEEQSRYETELVATISRTLAYIQAHLERPLSPHGLSEVACFSSHHFQRAFRSVVGESVMDHVRRVRLEKAAYRLKNGRETVATIALDAGYSAQEAFTRVFQAYFGIGPRAFRTARSTHRLPAPSGIHFSPGGCTPLRRAVAPELLDDEGLCSVHRRASASSPDRFERLLDLVTGFHFSERPRSFCGPLTRPIETSMSETLLQIDNEIDRLLAEIEATKLRLVEARKKRPKEPVEDYVLKDGDSRDVRLSELFGAKDDLIVVHNMGANCIYCTVWADGITGLLPHLSDRAALVVCSPDAPEVQRRFAAKRGWNFTMVSSIESPFPQEMGFWGEGPDAGPWPGVSTFHREPDGSIHRIAKIFLGSADGQSAMWPVLELLENGVDAWEPKFSYGERAS